MSNAWWEITIVCDSDLEEPYFWRLDHFGCRGTSTEVKGQSYLIRAYIPELQAHILDISALSLWLRQDAMILGKNSPMVQWSLMDEEDWASNWKKDWQPQEIGDRFLIYPAWLTPPNESERIILRLDPGVAFGTGAHATTQLCLESLEMRLTVHPETQTIAEIGCGSGILSIGAILLGAKQVLTVDTDPIAVKAARENRELNQLDPQRLAIKTGSIERLKGFTPEGFDGIVCNILAEVIIDLIPQMNEISKPTTWGILSGILLDQAKPIADTLEQNGWVVATLWKRSEWCCFNIRRA